MGLISGPNLPSVFIMQQLEEPFTKYQYRALLQLAGPPASWSQTAVLKPLCILRDHPTSVPCEIIQHLAMLCLNLHSQSQPAFARKTALPRGLPRFPRCSDGLIPISQYPHICWLLLVGLSRRIWWPSHLQFLHFLLFFVSLSCFLSTLPCLLLPISAFLLDCVDNSSGLRIWAQGLGFPGPPLFIGSQHARHLVLHLWHSCSGSHYGCLPPWILPLQSSSSHSKVCSFFLTDLFAIGPSTVLSP